MSRRNKKRFHVGPIYAFAIAWVIMSAAVPLYKIGWLITTLAVSGIAAAFIAGRANKKDRAADAAEEEKLRQQDSQFAAEAYTALEDYMVTDIASGTAAKIGEKLKQYKQLDTLTIDGENVIENGYWAYHLDESSREETVLQLFYEKVR